jgi:hypothetical protein
MTIDYDYTSDGENDGESYEVLDAPIVEQVFYYEFNNFR